MAKKKTAGKISKSTPKKKTAAKAVKKKAAAKKRVGTAAPRKKAKKLAATAPRAVPSRIAELAYLLYLDRIEQGLPGDERSDWLAAERALRVA